MKKALAVLVACCMAAASASCVAIPPVFDETQPPVVATPEPAPAVQPLSVDEAAIKKYTDQLAVREATDFTLKDLAGNEWKLSDLKGRLVLLNFWATWCGPCMGELPEFQKLYEKYGPDGPFVLLTAASVSLERKDVVLSKDEILKLAGTQSFTFPIVFDEDGKLWQAYSNDAIPVTYILGPSGKIRLTVVGAFNSADDVLAALEAVRRADSGK